MSGSEHWWVRRYQLLISEGPEVAADEFNRTRPVPREMDLTYAHGAIQAALRIYDLKLASLWSRYAYLVRTTK